MSVYVFVCVQVKRSATTPPCLLGWYETPSLVILSSRHLPSRWRSMTPSDSSCVVPLVQGVIVSNRVLLVAVVLVNLSRLSSPFSERVLSLSLSVRVQACS